jgi:hypothetical protein
MNKVLVAAALVFALGAASVQAEQPMSKSKLSSLGLASFQTVSDDAGMEVRGRGRAFAAGAFVSTAGTTGSGMLAYGFATRTPNATTFGSGQAVSNFALQFNGGSFVFAAQAFGGSFAFAP